MQILPPFQIGKRYAINGQELVCGQLTSYGGLLSGTQRASLSRPGEHRESFAAVRYPDGSVMRIQRAPEAAA